MIIITVTAGIHTRRFATTHKSQTNHKCITKSFVIIRTSQIERMVSIRNKTSKAALQLC